MRYNRVLIDIEQARWTFDINMFARLKELYNVSTIPAMQERLLEKMHEIRNKYPQYIKLSEIPHED